MDGVAALREIKAVSSATQVIVLSSPGSAWRTGRRQRPPACASLVSLDEALEDCVADLQGEADAETTVKSLLGRLPAFLPDDATVVVLRPLG